MNFLIADTFTKSLTRLQAQEQSAAKVAVMDLQLDPAAPGLKFHRIEKSKDADFWSIRAGRGLRIVVHKTKASFLVAYVGQHDDAYDWAERRRIETHPRTGVAQIVEVRERVEEIAMPAPVKGSEDGDAPEAHPLFWALDDDALLGAGVPEDWLADVKAADVDRFLALLDHLPSEASEALSTYVDSGELRTGEAGPVDDPFTHPDARRRFRVLDGVEELERALEAPWERWTVFLHPAQAAVAARVFNGPARVAGSAGTGKTVVALHRAARALRADADARVMLVTHAPALAAMLRTKLAHLATGAEMARATIGSVAGVAAELATLIDGRKPRIATGDAVRAALAEADDAPEAGFGDPAFLHAEFAGVVDAWNVTDAAGYAVVPRLGRKTRIGTKQRAKLWPVFAKARELLALRHLETEAGVMHRVAAHWTDRAERPFSAIVVDEAQDLGPPALRMLAALAPDGPDPLFFAGDQGQRIFQEAFSWKKLGIDIRGRSHVLRVNYRTSHQIRTMADGLLPGTLTDADGNAETRGATVSVFEGPAPSVVTLPDAAAEAEHVGVAIRAWRGSGIPAAEIGLFVRGPAQLARARDAVERAGEAWRMLDGSGGAGVAVGTMNLAKGMEFRAVVLMACDDGVLPDDARLAAIADPSDIEEVYETERRLLYVAATRARDAVLVTGVAPGSVFLDDLVRPAP